MEAALVIAPLGAALLAMIFLVEGLLRRRRLLRTIDQAWREVPRDHATGLFDRTVCLQRVAAEIKRARRGGGSVWVGVITVLDGDADRFGRLLHDSMRMPEVGFRVSDTVVCVARPDIDDAARTDLLGRILAAAPRERLALGEGTWRDDASDGDASALLSRAGAATREVRTR